MPLTIISKDITKQNTEAIVNAANTSLLGGGGVDGAIHKAAGPKLLEECKKLNGCKTGQAKLTKGYDLPCKYVIHTVGPIYKDGNQGEEILLRACYKNSLELARDNGIESITFPLISSGIFAYPKDQAINIAIDEIRDFLITNDMDVYLSILNAKEHIDSLNEYPDLNLYIEDNYQPEAIYDTRSLRQENLDQLMEFNELEVKPLEDLVDMVDESFSEMLLRVIDEKNLDDVEVYKKANIDRKHFSKIRSNKHYKARKETILAFVFALELDLLQAEEMLMKAGYAFSNASKFDIIVKYFIENKIYDIYEVNKALFVYDQKPLG